MAHPRAWSSDDLARLREVYTAGGTSAAMAAFPNRSRNGLLRTAARYGIRNRPPRWTHREDAQLRSMWGHEHMSAIARRLGRSEGGIFLRSKKLGLSGADGVPQGLERIYHACVRTGYGHNVRVLRRILVWAGVRILEAYTRPGSRGARRRYFLVDPTDVDDAIARYHRTETVVSGARRHDVAPITLRKWLEQAAVEVSRAAPDGHRRKLAGRGVQTRVESAEIDRVVAEHRRASLSGESAQRAARRVGVAVKTLYHWLHVAGVRTGHNVLIPHEVIDRVVRENLERPDCKSPRKAA